MKISDKNPDAVVAIFVTMILVLPKFVAAARYRRAVIAPMKKRYQTSKRGMEEAGLMETEEVAPISNAEIDEAMRRLQKMRND